jgi:hypothetical protein
MFSLYTLIAIASHHKLDANHNADAHWWDVRNTATTNYQLPTTNYQLPTTNCQLPTIICHLPSAICHLPSAQRGTNTTTANTPTAKRH